MQRASTAELGPFRNAMEMIVDPDTCYPVIIGVYHQAPDMKFSITNFIAALILPFTKCTDHCEIRINEQKLIQGILDVHSMTPDLEHECEFFGTMYRKLTLVLRWHLRHNIPGKCFKRLPCVKYSRAILNTLSSETLVRLSPPPKIEVQDPFFSPWDTTEGRSNLSDEELTWLFKSMHGCMREYKPLSPILRINEDKRHRLEYRKPECPPPSSSRSRSRSRDPCHSRTGSRFSHKTRPGNATLYSSSRQCSRHKG